MTSSVWLVASDSERGCKWTQIRAMLSFVRGSAEQGWEPTIWPSTSLTLPSSSSLAGRMASWNWMTAEQSWSLMSCSLGVPAVELQAADALRAMSAMTCPCIPLPHVSKANVAGQRGSISPVSRAVAFIACGPVAMPGLALGLVCPPELPHQVTRVQAAVYMPKSTCQAGLDKTAPRQEGLRASPSQIAVIPHPK